MLEGPLTVWGREGYLLRVIFIALSCLFVIVCILICVIVWARVVLRHGVNGHLPGGPTSLRAPKTFLFL